MSKHITVTPRGIMFVDTDSNYGPVLFKDQDSIALKTYPILKTVCEIPDGYTIEIKSEYVEPDDSIHCNRGDDIEYAILVPKQESMNKIGYEREATESDKPKEKDNSVNTSRLMSFLKQQSIEEAAAKYANDYDGMQWEKDRVEIAFIKGAKSQSDKIEELLAEAIKNRDTDVKENYRFWDGKVCAYEQLLHNL